MDSTSMITEILRLPAKFHQVDKSMFDLLKETGYFEKHDTISEAMIAERLMAIPECIEDWIQYSQDSRSDFPWYLSKINDKKCILGFYNTRDRTSRETEYTDCAQACAVYIKRKIDAIRSY